MTKQHWEQIEQLWQQALQIEPRHREAFVKNQTESDEAVRAEVLAMLRQEDHSADFLETSALENAARQLAHDKLNAPTIQLQGQRFGAYEVISELGAGGMGTVYLARDLHLDRTVAIKVLPDGFKHDPDRLKRFKREAEMLAKVNHPNVATLYDYDRESGYGPRYLVMEYVSGETLDERLKRGKLTAVEAAPFFRQIAEALAAAHAQGIIHRDLKPSNIKIMPDGVVKVLDFGLAKSTAKDLTWTEASTGARNGKATTLTQPQMILGTPGYMSPEQVRGEKSLDQRTDWWAFGCMFYEALSGRNPFRSHTIADTNAAILEKEPDWKTLPIETPTAIVRLVHRCLQKDPQRRVRNVSEVLPELKNIQAPTRLTIAAYQLRRAAPQLGLLAAGLAILISLFATYQWLKPKPKTMLAIIADQSASPCDLSQSEAIAKAINDKLRSVQGVEIVIPISSDRGQPFLMIDAALTQTALTAEATTILKVAATNCTNSSSPINYSLTRKDGSSLSSGTATDLSQLLLNVVSTLNLPSKVEAWQTSEEDRQYYRAVALLEHYVNEQSVKDALDILHRLEQADQINLARSKAALGWGYYLQDYLLQVIPPTKNSNQPNNREKALSYCDQATNLQRNDPNVLLMCGRVSTARGNLDKAITNFQSLLQQRENDPEAVLELAKAYEFKGEAKNAETQYLRALALRPGYWEVYNQLSGFYFEQGEFQKAEEYARRVSELLDLNPVGFNNLGITLLYQGRYDEAITAYYRSLDKKRLPSTYHSLGTTYLYAGQCNKAVEAFQQGKALDQEDAEFWGAEGEALSCMGQTVQAANAYEQAIRLMNQQDVSRDASSLSLLAEWYARRNNKKLALQKIEEALQLAPHNYDCIVSAIKVYKLTNEPEKLMIQFEKAVKNRKSLFEVEHDPCVNEITEQETYRKIIEQHKTQRG